MLRPKKRFVSRMRLPLLLALLGLAARAELVTTHPGLLFRSRDLPNLRARMTPTNDTWVLFKQEVVDPCLRDWHCSSVSEYRTNLYYLSTDSSTGQVITNYYSGWARVQFTDEFGVTHHEGDTNWSSFASAQERPAAPEDDVGDATASWSPRRSRNGSVTARTTVVQAEAA